MIHFTMLQDFNTEGVVFDCEEEFEIDKILNFLDKHLYDYHPVVTMIPPQGVRRPNWGLAWAQADPTHWRTYARWGSNVVPRLDYWTRDFSYWVRLEGEWVHVSYAPSFDACLIVSQIMQDDRACDRCGLSAHRCKEEWMKPTLRRDFGADDQMMRVMMGEGTRAIWKYDRSERRQELAAIKEPGFEWVHPRIAAGTGSDPFFPREDDLVRNVNFQKEAIAEARVEAKKTRQRATERRKEHNATCGYVKDRCLFRDWKCQRWRSARCGQRWHSTKEVVEAGLNEAVRRYGALPRADLNFARAMGAHSFRGLSRHTERPRFMHYRGVVLDGNFGVLEHSILSQDGHDFVDEFTGDFQEMLRFLRRRAPREARHFNAMWNASKDGHLPDETILMMLEFAQERYYDGRQIYGVDVDSKGRMWDPKTQAWLERPTVVVYAQHRRAYFSGIEMIMVNPKVHGWPAWSAFVPE